MRMRQKGRELVPWMFLSIMTEKLLNIWAQDSMKLGSHTTHGGGQLAIALGPSPVKSHIGPPMLLLETDELYTVMFFYVIASLETGDCSDSDFRKYLFDLELPTSAYTTSLFFALSSFDWRGHLHISYAVTKVYTIHMCMHTPNLGIVEILKIILQKQNRALTSYYKSMF